MKNFNFKHLVLFLLFIGGLAGCGNSYANDNHQNGNGNGNRYNTNRLVVAMEGDAVSLDPHLSNVTISSQYNVQMFETLVQLDPLTGEPFGVLAEHWKRIDDYSVEFNLKQGVYFHDGQQMTAEDVEFSIRRAAKSPQVAAIMEDFDPNKIEIIDDFTIRIGTREPFAPFLNNIAHPAAAILSQYSFEKYGEQQFGEQPIGTGPFLFYRRAVGDYVEFRRFDKYHGELPTFEELQLRTVVEPFNRLIQLETGEADIAFIGRSDIQRAMNTPSIRIEQMPTYQIVYLGMNVDRIPDVRVRQAINYAVDVTTIHQTVMYEMGDILTGPLGANVFGARTDLPEFGLNQNRAKELLAESGYENGLTLRLVTNEFPERVAWAQAIAAQLEPVGIAVEIQTLENPIFLDETAEGKHDLFILAWTTVTGDGDYGLFPLFHSSNHGAPGNRTFFNNSRADELMEIGRASFDDDMRLMAYYELQKIIRDEAPMVFLSTGELVLGAHDGVTGVFEAMGPANHIRFQHVHFNDY